MQNRFKHVALTLLLAFTTLFSPNVLRADVTGSILGVVRDSTQAVVAGARIVATNVQTNFKQETVSAADGSFRFLALPAGTYKLTATAPGFQTFTTTDIDLKVNDQLRVDVALEAWRGIAAPKGTPKPVISMLEGAIRQTVATSEYAKASADLGVRPAYLPAAEFGELIAKEDGELATLMRMIGIEKPAK